MTEGRQPPARFSRREWLAVWLWAGLWAGVMIAPYVRRADMVRRRPGLVFTGVISTEFVDTGWHLSWARQAMDGHWLFELKYAGADAGAARAFNLLFLVMGLAARWTGAPLVHVFHVERTVFAVLTAVTAYWFAGQFLRHRRQRWLALILVTTSGGLEGVVALVRGSGRMTDLFSAETVTFWSHEWWVIIGPGTVTLLLVLASAHRALLTGGRRRFVVLGSAMLLQVCVYPHHVPTAFVVVAATGLVWAAAAPAPRRRVTCRRVAGTLGVMLLGAGPGLAWYAFVLLRDASFRAYAGQADEWLWGSVRHWPVWFGVTLAFGAAGAAAIIVRRNARRAMLVIWPLFVLAMTATPYPRISRVHLLHGLHTALCCLSAVGLWAVGRLLGGRWSARRPGLARAAATAGLAVVVGLGAVTNVIHYATELRDYAAAPYAAMRVEEAEALGFIDRNAADTDVVLCLLEVGQFVPPYTGSRVYIGHGTITPNAEFRSAVAARFMGKEGAISAKEAAVILDATRADLVYVEPRARRLGAAATERTLVEHGLAEQVYANALTAVYRVDRRAVRRLAGAPDAEEPIP